ncbi:MAG: hypothetical protein JWM19_871 [Actinomycetia bacterium]|nr:hypothetical protein [Actinomycetes bacterium]
MSEYDDLISHFRDGGRNQEGAWQPVIPASKLPRAEVPEHRVPNSADKFFNDLLSGVPGSTWEPTPQRAKRGFDSEYPRDLDRQIREKRERNIGRELDEGHSNVPPASNDMKMVHLRPGMTDEEMKPVADALVRHFDSVPSEEEEREHGLQHKLRHPGSVYTTHHGDDVEGFLRDRWQLREFPWHSPRQPGELRPSNAWVRKAWQRKVGPLACEHEKCPPWECRQDRQREAAARVAASNELPDEQDGLYWRAHVRSAPFDAGHAWSTPTHPRTEEDKVSRRGYSCFSDPYHLAQYMPDHFGEDSDHREVLAFHGRHSGTGTDGEPLAVPEANPHCCGQVVHDRMPWHEFERRAWDTGHTPDWIRPLPTAEQPWEPMDPPGTAHEAAAQPEQSWYYGTTSEHAPGDQIEHHYWKKYPDRPDFRENSPLYTTTDPSLAAHIADLRERESRGESRGRLYEVQPTGPLRPDEIANPLVKEEASWQTSHPLHVVREVPREEWPQDLNAWHREAAAQDQGEELLGHFEAAVPEHETWYHLTDNPRFALNPEHEPEDNSISIHQRSGKGIYLTRSPESWINGHDYVRPYVAEFHVHPAVHEHDANGRWGGELYVPAEHYDKLHLHRVIPVDAHAREEYREPGWIESHHRTAFDTGNPVPDLGKPGWRLQEGYRYPGPDVRDMPAADVDRHRDRWLGYLRENRGFDEESIGYQREQHDSHRTAAARPGRGEKPCPCCKGDGSHGDGSECAACGSTGSVGRSDQPENCPGQPQPRRRHWREGAATPSLEFRDEFRGSHGGHVSWNGQRQPQDQYGTWHAHDPQGGEHLGKLDYRISEPGDPDHRVLVEDLKADEGKGGRGVASALMDHLYAQHPEPARIEHGYRTDEGGGWWDKYVSSRPEVAGREERQRAADAAHEVPPDDGRPWYHASEDRLEEGDEVHPQPGEDSVRLSDDPYRASAHGPHVHEVRFSRDPFGDVASASVVRRLGDDEIDSGNPYGGYRKEGAMDQPAEIPAAERTESVRHILDHYKPYDADTWDEVRGFTDWDHPKVRAFVDDIGRRGVLRPIPIDYEQDPPQVRNGHTRLLSAERAGVETVPTRQHEGWVDPDDDMSDEYQVGTFHIPPEGHTAVLGGQEVVAHFEVPAAAADVTLEHREMPSGGSSYPHMHVITATHPDGTQAELRYMLSKRNGKGVVDHAFIPGDYAQSLGVPLVREARRLHPGTFVKGLPGLDEDWDRQLPSVSSLHRHLTMRLEPADRDFVHDESVPAARRAAHLMDLMERGGPSMHWASQRGRAAAEQAFGDHEFRSPEHTQVALSARPPSPEHVETDPERISRNGGYAYQAPDWEVPIKAGAPVTVSSVRWRTGTSSGWTRHQFRDGHQFTAGRVPADDSSAAQGEELLGHFEAAEGDYRGTHTAPNPAAGDRPLHHYTGEGPGDPVSIYRSAPAGTESINPGDWISLNPAYAHTHGFGMAKDGGNWPVYTARVPQEHVHWDENDENEHGYNGPSIHHPDVHDEETGARHDWEAWHDEHPHGQEAWAGGAVHLPQQEHDLVHDDCEWEPDRADAVLDAARRQGTLRGSRWHDDLYPARDDAEERAATLTPPEGHRLTTFTVHRGDSGRVDDVAVHPFEHGDEKIRRYQNMDLSDHGYEHKAADEIGRQPRQAALSAQASDPEEYGMRHRPGGPDDESGAPMHDVEDMLPGAYDRPQLYTYGDPVHQESARQLKGARGKPDAPVTVYRALPHPHQAINPGDWVATSAAYARQHGESNIRNGQWHVIRAAVPAGSLWSEGNSISEWGYHGPAIQGERHEGPHLGWNELNKEASSGPSSGDSYRQPHQGPDADDGEALHELGTRGFFPPDVYDRPSDYGADSQTAEKMRKARGNPDERITMYRAMPSPHHKINPGDWVTLSRDYALSHAEEDNPARNYAVLRHRTWARYLRNDGNDLNEWTYHGPTEHFPSMEDKGGAIGGWKNRKALSGAQWADVPSSDEIAAEQNSFGHHVAAVGEGGAAREPEPHEIAQLVDHFRDAERERHQDDLTYVPEWGPLHKALPEAEHPGWMFMQRHQAPEGERVTYKHGITRANLTLDHQGRAFGRDATDDSLWHGPFEPSAVLNRRGHYQDLRSMGESPESVYDEDYRARRNQSLGDAGYHVVEGSSPAEPRLEVTAAEEAPPQPRAKRWYHGTRHELSPGDELEGGIHASNQGYGQPGDHVYYSGKPSVAGLFAQYASGPEEDDWEGTPRVYQVEPDETHERDPDEEEHADSWRARKARVLREVPWQPRWGRQGSSQDREVTASEEASVPENDRKFYHGTSGTYSFQPGDLLTPGARPTCVGGYAKHVYYTSHLPSAATYAGYGHPLNDRGYQDLNAEARPGHVYEVVPEAVSGRRISRHAEDPYSGVPGNEGAYRTRGRLRVLHEVDRETGEPLGGAEHTAALTGEAADDEPLQLHRGLFLGHGTPGEADELHRNPAAHLQTRGGVGVHWTDDEGSAFNFAQDLDPEGWAQDHEDDDEGGSHSLGMVLHGEVHPRHVIRPGTPEWENYQAFAAVLDHDHPEREVPLRESAPVRVTHVTTTSMDPAGNVREVRHPWGREHLAGVAADQAALNVVAHFEQAASGDPLAWDEIGERHPALYGDPEVHGEQAAGSDGRTIGWAASQMAHAPGQPMAAPGSGRSLLYRREMVDPADIRRMKRGWDEERVSHAREEHARGSQAPPVVLVHRGGAYHLADGEHRTEAAARDGRLVDAYVHYAGHETAPATVTAARPLYLQQKMFDARHDPHGTDPAAGRHNPEDPLEHLRWRSQNDENYEPQECEHCGADLTFPEEHADAHHQWLTSQDWYTDWDHEQPGDTLHRGVGLDLPDHVHNVVHDESRPVHERAHALLSHVLGDGNAGGGGLGNFWSDHAGVSKVYAESSAQRYGRRNMQTPVMLHVHNPGMEHVETDPDELRHWGVFSYHLSGNREVPISNGAPLRVKGISWAPPGHQKDAGTRDEPPRLEDDEAWTHHEVPGEGIRATASGVLSSDHAEAQHQELEMVAHFEDGEDLPFAEEGDDGNFDHPEYGYSDDEFGYRHPKHGWRCSACDSYHNDPETARDHETASTNWDEEYPQLPAEMHRGMRLDTGHSAFLGHPGISPANRAQEILSHVTDGHGHVGDHWTPSEHQARHYGVVGSGHQGDDSDLNVVIHARRPDREDIETDPDTLAERGVYGMGYHEDQEIPLRTGAPVHVTGVSWKFHHEPDGAWQRHDISSPEAHMAALDPGDEPGDENGPRGPEQEGEERWHAAWGVRPDAECPDCNTRADAGAGAEQIHFNIGGQDHPSYLARCQGCGNVYDSFKSGAQARVDRELGQIAWKAHIEKSDLQKQQFSHVTENRTIPLTYWGDERTLPRQADDAERQNIGPGGVRFRLNTEQGRRMYDHRIRRVLQPGNNAPLDPSKVEMRPDNMPGIPHPNAPAPNPGSDYQITQMHRESSRPAEPEAALEATAAYQGYFDDDTPTMEPGSEEGPFWHGSGHRLEPGRDQVRGNGFLSYFTPRRDIAWDYATSGGTHPGWIYRVQPSGRYHADDEGIRSTYDPLHITGREEAGPSRPQRTAALEATAMDDDDEWDDEDSNPDDERDDDEEEYGGHREYLEPAEEARAAALPYVPLPPEGELRDHMHHMHGMDSHTSDLYMSVANQRRWHYHEHRRTNMTHQHEELRGIPGESQWPAAFQLSEHTDFAGGTPGYNGRWDRAVGNTEKLRPVMPSESSLRQPAIVAHFSDDDHDYGDDEPQEESYERMPPERDEDDFVWDRRRGLDSGVTERDPDSDPKCLNCSGHAGAEVRHMPEDGHDPEVQRRLDATREREDRWDRGEYDRTRYCSVNCEMGHAEDRARGIGVHHTFAEGEPEHDEARLLHGEMPPLSGPFEAPAGRSSGRYEVRNPSAEHRCHYCRSVLPQYRRQAALADADDGLDWSEVANRHPALYGDPEVHGDEASEDGNNIADAAAHLYHDRPEQPYEETYGGLNPAYGGGDMKFHPRTVDPSQIDYARHERHDPRVQEAYRGYSGSTGGEVVPPLVLVHRHGVYQVADGHHRAQGADMARRPVKAYVAYSPHGDEPNSDGDRGPYHGASTEAPGPLTDQNGRKFRISYPGFPHSAEVAAPHPPRTAALGSRQAAELLAHFGQVRRVGVVAIDPTSADHVLPPPARFYDGVFSGIASWEPQEPGDVEELLNDVPLLFEALRDGIAQVAATFEDDAPVHPMFPELLRQMADKCAMAAEEARGLALRPDDPPEGTWSGPRELEPPKA